MYKIIFVCVLMGVVLAGCKPSGNIQVKYESKFDQTLKNIAPQAKKSPAKSSGVYIYKYENKNTGTGISDGFGPSDMNFDFPK